MNATLPGIHHVTAIVGDAQRNLDFYSDTLGLRLVKLTVNFDDPGTYHLYFGDAAGQPGTIITFFPWGEAAPRGRRGSGQVTATAFSVAEGALDFWADRLAARGVETRESSRFGERILAFSDPDGLELELAAHPGADARPGQSRGDIPHAFAIRGLHSVT
ncbi:MAG TPA: VOC family protein, partial [Herpetosiphonaceae bacterium]